MKTTTPANDLRTALERLGAREFEIVALGMDPPRALAAIAYAQAKGADNPIAYAVKIFDNPEWQPRGERKTLVVNASVDVQCENCNGDRFVLVTDGLGLYDETYAPCADCNAKADTKRWVGNELRITAPR